MTAKQKHGAVLGLTLLLITVPAMAVPETLNCGQLQAASNAAKNQQNAITQGALKVFKPQPSVSMMSCLRNLMNTHVGFGMFGFNPGAILEGRGRSMAQGSFVPGFELAMARKDLRLMMETAGDRPLAALPGIAARMDTLIAAGHGRDDVGVIAIDAVSR